MKQTYQGGCHCGAVRYEAALDLSAGTVKCNCSICAKARAWLAQAEDFRLVQGSEALSIYRFGVGRVQHVFCKVCGIKSFGRVVQADGSEAHVVLVSCLDTIADATLATLPVMYIDGRHDDFRSAPAEVRHL